MAELFDITDNVLITNAVESVDTEVNVHQIVNHARDGSTYMQIIGTAETYHTVICTVTREQHFKILRAWGRGNLLRIIAQMNGYGDFPIASNTYYGRIVECSHEAIPNMWDGKFWQDYFRVTFKIADYPAPN